MNEDYQLLDEKAAAKLLSVSPGTLRVQRCTGATPNGLPKLPYIKIGRCVRYRLSDIVHYIDSHIAGNERGAL